MSAPWVIALIPLVVAACGAAVPGVRSDCPRGQTSLDGTCVTQQIADYVGCVRATGATVASDSAKSLSATAGLIGVTASTQGEVKDQLEKRYATVSDQNALEIVRDCNTKTARRTDVGEAASQPDSETERAPAVAAQGDATPVPRPALSALAGVWHCVHDSESVPDGSAPIHRTELVVYTTTVNGDGTVTELNPGGGNQCPKRWSVDGSRATLLDLNIPCQHSDGSYLIRTAGTATVSGSEWDERVTATVGGPTGAARVKNTFRCTR